MNTQTISSPVIRAGTGSAGARRTILILMLLVLVRLATLAITQARTEAQTVAPAFSGEHFLAANPELMAAQRYVSIPLLSVLSEPAVLARNPELSAFRRAAAATTAVAADLFLAHNPELSAARRTVAAASAVAAGRSLLAQNPELSVTWRYEAGTQVAEDRLLAANPELAAARRHMEATK